ncbi:MAG: hypothetical protein RIE77_03090 [Phycisphaerales bacterium]
MADKRAHLRDAMLDADLAMLPDAVRRWRPMDELRAARATWIDQQLSWCNDRKVAVNRATNLLVGAPRDFLNVVIDAAGARTLCGIRHYGGDGNRPFVDLVATTDAHAWTGDRLAETATAAMAAYPAFEPPMVRIPVAGSTPLPLPPGWVAEVDQALIGATIGEMLERAPATELPSVVLRDATVDDAMEFEADSYDAFQDRNAALQQVIRPSGRDEIEACANEGRVLHWFLRDEPGTPAGLLCIQRIDFHAMDGYLVVEECVAGWAAGRRSAAAAQRELARTLVADDGANASLPMFGTIMGENAPSLATARRSGREVIGAVWFVQRDAESRRLTPRPL